jgi:hypothetical protein
MARVSTTFQFTESSGNWADALRDNIWNQTPFLEHLRNREAESLVHPWNLKQAWSRGRIGGNTRQR